jgi:glycosyltransferase involved in cell wall biosynthesis
VSETVDVALVTLGTTPGLRRAEAAFADQLRAAGLTCDVREISIGRAGALRRNPAVTDLVEALAARRAARHGGPARFTIYYSVTAGLLQPRSGPYAVRFDSPAALNRPGASGLWQRRRERRMLAGARVLIPTGSAAGEAAPGTAPRIVVPIPIPEVAQGGERAIDACTYAGNPHKRGLDIVCRAWAKVAYGARLVVGGIDREAALRFLERRGVAEPPGVEWRGSVPHERWLETIAGARLFVNASRWEDYGISQLEALSAGAGLVTVPSPGPYEALGLARRLAPELADDDLAAALTRGLALGDSELESYRREAAEALAPYRPEAVQRIVTERLVPLLSEA